MPPQSTVLSHRKLLLRAVLESSTVVLSVTRDASRRSSFGCDLGLRCLPGHRDVSQFTDPKTTRRRSFRGHRKDEQESNTTPWGRTTVAGPKTTPRRNFRRHRKDDCGLIQATPR